MFSSVLLQCFMLSSTGKQVEKNKRKYVSKKRINVSKRTSILLLS